MLNFSDVTSFLKDLGRVLFNILTCIIIVVVINLAFFYGPDYFDKDSLAKDSTLEEIAYSEDIEPEDLEEFISLDSLKVLEPRLYSWIQQKNPKFNYNGYGILDKEGYTFLFGLSDIGNIVLNITILKGDSLVNEICPMATVDMYNDTTELTEKEYLAKCDPLGKISKYGVKFMDMEDRISFEDINNDGLLDFIIMYDRGGSMGHYNLMAYQKSDASGFEEKMNSTVVMFDKERNLVFTGVSAGRYGYYRSGVDPITLEDVSRSVWENLSDSIIEFEVERYDLNLKFTHQIFIKETQEEFSLPYDEIHVVMDSLNCLAMLSSL